MRLRKKAQPGLSSVAPVYGGFRLDEEINVIWLWLVGGAGASLIVLGLLMNLVWSIDNILPSACLRVGVGAMLFALLFIAERRVVRRTSVIWVSALEEQAARTGQNAGELAAHFAGPVAAVNRFVHAILDGGDYELAWREADSNWRLCRAQAWIWNNRSHPSVARFDRDLAAQALAEEHSTHELWPSFAQTELDQFREAWSQQDLRTFGAASASRKVDAGEIVLLVDLSHHPDGAIAFEPTPVSGVSFLVREIDRAWRIANLVGDRLPIPGWPPDWNEGWGYWERVLGQYR